MGNYLDVANSPLMWAVCAPTVLIVLSQVVVFTRKTMAVAQTAGITRQECFKAFRTGLISALGPSIAVFIVMVGLMSSVGAPISWLRLSIIGSSTAEMTNAGLGASAVGATLGDPSFDMLAYSAAVWGMSIFTFGWVISFFFIPRASKIQASFVKRDKNYLMVASSASMIGIMSYMSLSNALKGWDMAAAAIVAGLVVFLLSKTSKKLPWLREYHMGISMLVGMVAAIFVAQAL